MTWLWVAAGVLAVWFPVAFAVGVAVGRAIKRADDRQRTTRVLRVV